MHEYEAVHRHWLPRPGEGAGEGGLVPHGWRVVPALVAGLLWSAALAALTLVPTNVQWARQHVLSSPGDNIAWARVDVAFVAAGLALALAYPFSLLAHGDRRSAPTAVKAARVLTWAVVLGMFLFAAWIQANPRACVLGCGPLFG
jgi:predicted permease